MPASTITNNNRKEIDAITELNEHLMNFPPLLALTVTELRTKKTKDLDISLLAGRSDEEWEAKIKKVTGNKKYPDQYKTRTKPEKDYAHDIAESFISKFPTAAIIAKIGETKIESRNIIKRILEKNTDFDISQQSAHTWFKVAKEPKRPNEITEQNLGKIQEFQRCIKLTEGVNKLHQAEALMLSGITSAHRIYTMGKYDFKQEMKKYGLAEKEMNFIICRAKTIYDSVNYLSTQFIRYDSSAALVPYVMQYGSQGVTPPLQIPDMETIFGSLNTCSCTHCQSVYSAAAYFTDLLHWTKSDVVCENTGVNAYGVLTAANRRPDIPHLLLNCKNTNTLIPYIDLVNEILSVNLLLNPTVTDFKLLQTTKETSELLLQPEHRFDTAEDELKKVFYPWLLPYDPKWDEATTYLKKLGISHNELINSFSKQADKYNNIHWAKAFLGLNEEEYLLIINNNNAVSGDPFFWKNYWGMNSQPGNIGPVLKNAELNIEELKELLKSVYITESSPGNVRTIEIKPPVPDDCDIEKYTFSHPFTESVADRFLRFLRLKRKCGLSVWELDLAIKNFGGDITESFIINLSSCLAFCKAYNISFPDLMLWFNENAYQELLKHTFNPTQYFDNKFQNELLPNEIRDFFGPAPATNCFNTMISNFKLSDADKQKLGTVLNIEIPDIDVLTDYFIASSGGSFTSTSKLSFENISRYDRYARFSKVLGIEIVEMSDLFKLIFDPLIAGNATPVLLWSFTYQWNEFIKLNQKPSEFKDIISGKGYFELDADGRAINIDFKVEVKDLWTKIRDAVIATRNAYPDGYDNKNMVNPDRLPNAPALGNIVYKQLEDKFGFDMPDIRKILQQYSANSGIDWVNGHRGQGGYIGDATSWDWLYMEGEFTRGYLLLKRISLLMGICDLDAKGINAGVKIGISNSLNYPLTNAFYWLTNDFSSISASFFLSVNKAAIQAARLVISQDKYFEKISLLLNHGIIVADTDVESFAEDLYADLGEDSDLKKLSEFEFKNIYFKAQSITANNRNLLDVIEAIFSILEGKQIIDSDFEEIWSWVWIHDPSTGINTPANLRGQTSDLRRILQSRYASYEAWSKFILPIQNGFRSRLRDALVAYYIGEKGFKDSNAIYDRFLLDTEMEPCMKTSRMVLNISSIQLMIHRAMMGLEPDVCMDSDDINEWDWRKNYRVWEANRKIFLYPENWIEPEFRLDKSPFFKEAEDLLLQDDVNEQNCEKAFSGYLSHLNETARLDIRGTFIDEDSDPDVVHVFARTWNAPYIYFYRKRENNVWSAWEKLELDIEGDHIIPIIFNRRLYLIWPMFIEKEHRKIKREIDGELQNSPYYEIKMCHSKLEFGKWTNKKILNGTMYAGQYSGPGVFNNLERKLGKGIPNRTLSTINNPDYNPAIWSWGPPHRGGYPDFFAPHGPLKQVWISGDTHRGNLVLDNPNFPDYSYVDLDKKSFFFWGKTDKDTGDLTIHCRRDFHPVWEKWHLGYAEMAYEDSFKISACDEKVEIIPPVVVELGPTDKRFVAQPFNTLKDAMLLKQGVDREDWESPDNGMFVKKLKSYAPDKIRLFGNTNPSYTLTYPHQYKDALWYSPFFFSDKKHTFFIERKKVRRCVCTTTETTVAIEKEINCEYKYFDSGKFLIRPHEHHYSCTMLAEFNRYGIKGLLDSENPNIRRQLRVENYFDAQYLPESTYVSLPYPKDDYDFDRDGAYSLYNWEIFFHLVSVVGKQLRQNNKFAEAIKWLQYIFDPTNREGTLGTKRVWKIKPFMTDVSNGSIQNMMRLLSSGGLTPAEDAKREELVAQIEDWRDNPFEPHRIASMRPRAYMLWTILEYIDTLTEWGDWLFRQDSMESINEATNIYILAAKLLGERPEKISKSNNTDISYFDIAGGLDPFSNAAVNIENQMTGMTFSSNCTCGTNPYQNGSGFSLPNLLFCIPDNPKLIEYWNRVEDRLFKIRHCMNIDGKVRDLALFQPPIDPALLVRAKALGLDISEVLSDLASPSPHYRFSYLLQKASDFCNEVKSLGGQLLSALEKKDAEELSMLRQLHEQNILKATRNLKKLQIEEAKQTMKSLEHTKKLIEIRLNYYESREYVSSREQKTIDLTKTSEGFMYVEQGANLLASLINFIPDTYAGYTPLFKLPGGDKISYAIKAVGGAAGIVSSVYRNKASMSATYAGYDRRLDDWKNQINTAKEELKQIEVQLLGAEIRIAITEKELDNHDLQAEQSAEIYDWVRSKFTNEQLYGWMSGELMKLHHKAYGLAYDMAKQAQRAFEKELTGTDPQIINFGHWDSSRKGLLAGDRLGVQLKELESNYMKLNTREFELTKSISVKLLDPVKLVDLIKTGKCEDLKLPEWLFNLEFEDKNLYAMRIKSISVSVPCITGPQTSVNVKLRMKESSIGWNVNNPNDLTNLTHFNEEIITSSAMNDPAVFETKEERYMPFENHGVISKWDLSLPNQHEFDYSTISDVVLHVRYVAKGSEFTPMHPAPGTPTNRNEALKYTQQFMSLRHDFPQEWHRIVSNPATLPDIPAYEKLTSVGFLPTLGDQFIPYRMRLAGMTTGVIEKIFYLFRGLDNEIYIKEVENIVNSPQRLLFNNSELSIKEVIPSTIVHKVEDIWIMYKYQN